MRWASYVKTLLLTTVLSALIVSAWILLLDPYDNVWFSPPLERAPVAKNQRFSYPALARKPRFDSLIVGTSSVRLLRPGQLDPLLGAEFVNLAMNAATPYEQSQILSVFVRHHPRTRYAFLGVDDSVWCTEDHLHAKLGPRTFPPWMYDENRWNDLLYLFNAETLEQGWNQFRNLLGIWEPHHGGDGYKNFLPADSRYDIEMVRGKLYEGSPPHLKPAAEPPEPVSREERGGWTFPNLELLQDMLRALPKETVKVLVFPPYHQFRLPAPGSRQAAVVDECKARVVRMAQGFQGTTVIDFMIRSRISLEDENFWDPQHYRVGVATLIGDAIADALDTGRGEDGVYRILARPHVASEVRAASASSY
ncbi:MAG: hypothetical protein U9Q81_02635 [Pseudomonadota bacterium]|nr:hypothetical protein [Pseudomonadota bacterium]